MAYSSNLTDAEWEIFEPLLQEILPTKKQTRPTNWPKRDIFNGILYQLKNGCNWQEIMTKIQFQLSTKPSKQEKAAQGKSGESSGNSQMGDRTLQCLDGALQNSG